MRPALSRGVKSTSSWPARKTLIGSTVRSRSVCSVTIILLRMIAQTRSFRLT